MVSEEELSNMSPEELAEFQKQNCVFCQIGSGKIPSKTVYSDDKCVAVLDINPAAKGHMLLMPKEHFSVMPQLPDYLVDHMFMVVKSLSQAALKALSCRGTTIFVANGVAAGQKAPHFMIHIIPRNEDDGINLEIPSKEFTKKNLEAVKTVLTKILSKKASVPAEVEKVTKPKPAKKQPVKSTKKKTSKKSDKFDLDTVTKLLSDQNG